MKNFPNNQVVARGGISDIPRLKEHCKRDVRNDRGHISARSIYGNLDVDILIKTVPFPHGQISCVKVGEVRELNNPTELWDVIDDSKLHTSPYHASIVCPDVELSEKQAGELSSLFITFGNYWRSK
ncbi:hypothetical protein [Peribacillus frigoritolerans]|uniref:hypothetical protein n=1 Tax=Peribacillus frigoritolerans TaxID=450367 RepID=UPI00203BBBD9|nr:hypothetical protein [Peribacillus frigoritolerans]MCM3167928.1 hypothetical protein [Peribacillus frigoritolerans]